MDIKNKLPVYKTIAKGGSISFFGSLAMLLLTLVFQWTQARYLGASGVGIIGVGIAVTGLVSVLTLFGFQRSLVKFIPHYIELGDPGRAKGTIISALAMFGALSLAAVAILLGSAEFLAQDVFNEPDLEPVLRILTFAMPFTGLTLLLVAVAQAFKRVEHNAVIVNIAKPTLKIILLLVLASSFARTPTTVAYAILIAAVAGAIIAVVSVWRLKPTQAIIREKPVFNVRELWSFSWPLLLTMFVNRSEGQVGMLMIGSFSTSAEAGIFKIGVRVTVLMTVFLTALNTIFAPIIAELNAKSNLREVENLFRTVTKWAFSFSLPVFLFLVALAPEIMSIFGAGFIQGAPVLYILALSQLIFVVTGPVGWIITMTGHTRLNLINACLALASTALIDFFLVPIYGGFGAAIGQATSRILLNLTRLFQVYLILRIHPYRWNYFKPLLSAIFAATGVWMVEIFLPDLELIWHFTYTGVVIGLIYFSSLVILGLDEADRQILRALERRIDGFIKIKKRRA